MKLYFQVVGGVRRDWVLFEPLSPEQRQGTERARAGRPGHL